MNYKNEQWAIFWKKPTLTSYRVRCLFKPVSPKAELKNAKFIFFKALKTAWIR